MKETNSCKNGTNLSGDLKKNGRSVSSENALKPLETVFLEVDHVNGISEDTKV